MKHYELPDWWVYGQKILAIDLNRIESGINATNILTPHQNDPPDMEVYVSGGYVYFDEHAYYFVESSSPAFDQPSLHPRWDILCLDITGTLVIVKGEEAASPIKPSFGIGHIPIAYIYNRVGESKLLDFYEDNSTDGYILDARRFLSGADMQKSVYDGNNDGVVNNSERLGGTLSSEHLLRNGSRKLTSHLDFDNHNAINLLDPSLGQDAATKTYVDGRPFELVKSDKVAGEPLVFGNVICLTSDNKWYKADAWSDITAVGLLAMVLSASVNTNESVSALIIGIRTNASWSFTRGAILYLGGSAGTITETKPSETGQLKRKIGFAYNTDTVYFNPDSTVQEVP